MPAETVSKTPAPAGELPVRVPQAAAFGQFGPEPFAPLSVFGHLRAKVGQQDRSNT